MKKYKLDVKSRYIINVDNNLVIKLKPKYLKNKRLNNKTIK